MAWVLTTPYSGGDLDPVGVYNQVKIRRMLWDDARGVIQISLEYGTTVDGKWVPGMMPVGKASFVEIVGEAYDTLVSTATPSSGELTYVAVKRGLYEWLQTNGHLDAGAIG